MIRTSAFLPVLRRDISYNPAVCFANLHTFARPFAAKLRPSGRFPFLLIRPPGLESLNLSDGLPLELF
jgi:hypothetical protein